MVWSRGRAFVDHKRPIKTIEPFALSFFSRSDSFRDLFYAVLLSCITVIFNKIWQLITLYIDGLEGRAFDHHRRNGGGAFANKNCPHGRAFEFFSNARGGDARGWN